MTSQTTDSKPFALIVEDDRRQSTIFAQALQMAGYETEVIRDGAKARIRLAEVTPSLVVLDLHLPHTSGREILKEINADERLTSTRVMLATADALMAESLRNKSDLVLLKPIGFNQMRDLAARLLPPPPDLEA